MSISKKLVDAIKKSDRDKHKNLGGVQFPKMEKFMRPGVYELRHPTKGPFYVGMSTNVFSRLTNHLGNSRFYKSKIAPIPVILEWLPKVEWRKISRNGRFSANYDWHEMASKRERHFIKLRIEQGFKLMNTCYFSKQVRQCLVKERRAKKRKAKR
jgi:hypothetical protein